MRVRWAPFVLLLWWMCPLDGGAAPREAVVLFTGDNAGEIADCGCRQGPAGGLARRKTMLARERAAEAPVLVLDVGNALFKTPTSGTEPGARERAQLLLEQMEALGTTAMAVGTRDLVLGTGFLKQGTRKAKMKVLSANLVDSKGQPLFTPSTVAVVKGVKFGVVGLSPEGPVEGEASVVGRPVLPAALAEARRLREKDKVDVVVVLAALPLSAAQALTAQLGEAVDFVLQSHEGRLPGVAQRHGQATLVPSGERGRQLGRLALSLDGTGPFVDLAEQERARRGLQLLDDSLQRGRERLAAEKDAATRAALEESVAGLLARRPQLEAQAQARSQGPVRTQMLSFIPLGPEVPADPELKQRVESLLPPGAAHP